MNFCAALIPVHGTVGFDEIMQMHQQLYCILCTGVLPNQRNGIWAASACEETVMTSLMVFLAHVQIVNTFDIFLAIDPPNRCT